MVANGSNDAPQVIGQVPQSPLNLNFVLYIPHCPYNLVSLNRLTRSLNSSVTFDANSFVIQEHGTRCQNWRRKLDEDCIERSEKKTKRST